MYEPGGLYHLPTKISISMKRTLKYKVKRCMLHNVTKLATVSVRKIYGVTSFEDSNNNQVNFPKIVLRSLIVA